MKKALISPNEVPKYLSSWADYQTPVFSDIPNSARVAEVTDTEFPVAAPLFWVNCDDNADNGDWHYDTVTTTVQASPAAAQRPAAPDQPQSNGTTPL